MKKKNNISQADKEIWSKYIKNPNDIFDKDLNSKKKKIFDKNLRYKFDLHGYTLEEANHRVKEIVLDCFKNRYSEILLITGKGIHSNTEDNIYVSKELSTLRYSIPEFINSDPELKKIITSINEGNNKEGGGGVLVLKLKKL